MSSGAVRGLSAYHKALFLLLAGATLFEGFDTALANLVLPFLGREFAAGPDVLGRTLSILNLGTVAAFGVILLADRWGRRPVMLIAVGGYSLLTLLTFFSRDLGQFALLQFGARMLMVTEIALAYVILSEELPARVRGRANGLLGAFGAFGAALPAVFLHPLESTPVGWRGLFLLGAIPLLFLPLYWKLLREPPLAVGHTAPRGSFWLEAARIVRPPYRVRAVGITFVWFMINFWSACAMFFFAYYVLEERDWSTGQIAVLVPVAAPFGFVGYAAAGWLMDRIGRRPTACIYLVLGAFLALFCYQTSNTVAISLAWVGLQMLQGMWPVANTITAELFPTEIRAIANGLTHNLLGRWGLVAGPAVVGMLAGPLGSTGNAVSALALVNLICLPVVIWLLPETRGVSLEASPASPAA